MKHIRQIVFLSIAVLTVSFHAQAFELKSSKTVLDNGMTVLITEMPNKPVVSVYALVKTGASTEGQFLGSGISHFLEHMLFKETTTRNVGEIASKIQAVGGSVNASTGQDYTIYTITVPFDEFDTALDIVADMSMNTVFSPEEVEKERSVVLNEMRLHNDNPDRKISRLVFQNVYIKHPYRHPVIGYQPLLEKITKTDLKEYYETHYKANNTIFSVAGNVKTEEILPKIQERFKDFQRSRETLRNLPQEPQQITERHYEEEYPTDLTRMSLAYSGVSLLDKDLFALDVLAKVLGQGRSSRLYKELYSIKGLVYSISAYNYTPMDRGVFWVSALLDEENVDEVQAEVHRQINEIKSKGISEKELEKAKRQVLSEHIFGQETTSRVAYYQALDESSTGDYLFSKKYVDAIKNVTREDIKRAAQKYLVPQSLTTVVLRPKKEKKAVEEIPEDSEITAIEKRVLDNGLTLLIKEDKSIPLVSLHLAMSGGTRQETEGNNGISNLTALGWTQGTKKYSSKEISLLSESLGMSLNSFSGRNSLGLTMDFLSEDLKPALDLLNELVRHPVFEEKEIGNLKEAVIADILQRNDNVFRFTYQELKETLFLKHPLRYDTNGTIENVQGFTRADLIAFYNTLNSPDNMVLSVVGDIDGKEVIAELQRTLGSLKKKDVELKFSIEKDLIEPRERQVSLEKEQAMVMLGFRGVDLKNKDRYGLSVLSTILGSSFSGRLFTTIREQKGKAYTLGGFQVPAYDAGMICFYVLTDKENVEDTKDLTVKEIQKIQSEPVGDQELTDIKTYLKGNFKAGLQTNAALSSMISLDELYGLGFDNYKNYDQNIDRVSAEEVRRLANTYLDLKKVAVVITQSERELDSN